MDRPGRLSGLLIYALLALVPLLWAARNSNINPRARVPDMVAGTAYRPYVYRTLVPRVIAGLDRLLPEPVHAAADSLVRRSPRLRDGWHWTVPHASWFLWALLFEWASLVAFAVAFERLARFWLGDPAGVFPRFAAGLMVLLVPIHFGYQNFIYDFPQLALFTLALALLADGRWGAYLIAFTIGLTNKETAVLLLPVFLVWAWGRLPGRRWVLLGLAQLALAAAVRFAIHRAYAHNPGETVEFHLPRNLSYHPAARQMFHDAVYAIFCVAALTGAHRLPRVALAALLVGGALFAATLFLGFLGEYRDFYELFPLLGLMLAAEVRANLTSTRRPDLHADGGDRASSRSIAD